MNKPYLTYKQQIDKLKNDKGLVISDETYAREMLMDIGYFSLIGGYKNLFINPMTRKYINGATFEDITSLYEFDEALRQLTFGYLIKVEQKIRQLISDSFCSKYGEDQIYYLSAASYNPATKYRKDINGLIKKLEFHAKHNNEKDYLIHQRKTYGNVPLWVTTKVLTFGQLSIFYSVLQFQQQSVVSKAYPNVSEKSLARYLNCMTLFRNVCAHNERLFSFKLIKVEFPDTPIHKKMGLPTKGNQYTIGKKDYFGLVIAFRYMLSRKDFLQFKRNLKKLIDSYCRKSKHLTRSELLKQMGMPKNWETVTRYRLN